LRRTKLLLLLLALGFAAAAMIDRAGAQARPAKTSASQTTPGDNDAQSAPKSFWGIIFSGGLTGLLIVLVLLVLSMIAATLIFEHVMTLRAKVVIPPDFAPAVRELLVRGNVAAADQMCHAQPSFLAYVVQAGVSEIDGGWSAVEKAMEDAVGEQSARMFRKVEYLSVIGNIAPMVGLLGTVTGMIFAFQQVADTQGAARAADLAEGIYQALVTTVGGLLVAIPCLAAFAIFRNRVDQLVAEAAYVAGHVFLPLKRRGRARRSPGGTSTDAPSPPPPPPPSPGGA